MIQTNCEKVIQFYVRINTNRMKKERNYELTAYCGIATIIIPEPPFPN